MNIPKLRFKDNNGNDYPQWEKKLIKDILKIYHGKDYKNEPNEKKLYPVLGTGGIITYIDKFLCDWECVLIGRKGTINKPQYMKTPFWSVDTLFYSKPKLKQNPKFQYYLFQNINWKIYDESTGVPSLSASTIEHINRFIPTYAEQEKIASFFSTIDKKIENLANTITSLENQKKGLLQQIFSQKLRFKDENGNNNYTSYYLYELIKDIKSGNNKERIKTGLFPVYGSMGILGYNNNYIYDFTTILIARVGMNAGNVSLVTGKYDVSDNTLIIIPSNKINIYYLYYYLINFNLNKLVFGSGQPLIKASELKKIIIKIPCLEEQTKIADFLSAFDRKLENQKTQLEHWKQIKKGLLQQMFV